MPQLCLAFNWVTKFIYDAHKHRLVTLEQEWLAPQQLRTFADAIQQKGSPLNNCWGFVDGNRAFNLPTGSIPTGSIQRP